MKNENIKNRKNDHLNIVLNKSQATQTEKTNYLEYVLLSHNALPEINYSEIDCKSTFLGKEIYAPIMINAITGGTELAKVINENLAKAAQFFNIPMVVGSQRIILDSNGDENIKNSFKVCREHAPDIPLIANIGIAQVIEMNKLSSEGESGFKKIDEIINLIDADALSIHLNPLQELIQPEGEPNFKNGLESLSNLKKYLQNTENTTLKKTIPIIIKETGCGLSKNVAKRLIQVGFNQLDVSGIGGTSFSAIETLRQEKKDQIFLNWGIPTAASILEVKSVKNESTKIIASGGIRNGLDVAKSIVLGADIAGFAYPLIKLATQENNNEDVIHFLSNIIEELKRVMFLTGSKNIKALKKVHHRIIEPLKSYI